LWRFDLHDGVDLDGWSETKTPVMGRDTSKRRVIPFATAAVLTLLGEIAAVSSCGGKELRRSSGAA
jgi:hypothetical protein